MKMGLRREEKIEEDKCHKCISPLRDLPHILPGGKTKKSSNDSKKTCMEVTGSHPYELSIHCTLNNFVGVG